MGINFFALSGLLVAIVCFLMAWFIFSNSKKVLHTLWAVFHISVGIFGLGTFFVGISTSYRIAFWSWKFAFLGISFIASLFYHVVYEFCQLKNKKVLTLVYALSILMTILVLTTDTLFSSLRFAFDQFYYMRVSNVFNVLFLIWTLIVINSFRHLYIFIRTGKGVEVTQAKYLFWAMLCGFLGGTTTCLPGWGIDVYPWHFLVCVYMAISTFAIFRYRLMDLNIVVTRLGVFAVVYSLVLGIPFWIGWKMFGIGNWVIPVAFMAVFATVGPFLFLTFQEKAEARLLREQRSYQEFLRRMSAGMGRIRDLNRLLNLIVFVLTRSVRMSHALIYMRDDSQSYRLSALRKSRASVLSIKQVLNADSALMESLLKTSEPLIYDEVLAKAAKDGFFIEVENEMRLLGAVLAFPVFVRNDLISILVMGRKEGGRVYSNDDIAVFNILANQAALAIENAKSYQDMCRTQEKLVESEKMATIGFLVGGLAHQLKNRLTPLVFNAEFAARKIESSQGTLSSSDCHETLTYLQKISDGVESSKEVINGILNYASDRETKTDVDLKKLVAASIELIQFKIKPDTVVFENNIDHSVPSIKGNFAQLQEVIFNIIDNAHHSMMEKKAANQDPAYQPKMTFSAQVCRGGSETLPCDSVTITVTDNGMGVKEEHMKKLFTPLFSTKAKTKQGHGLGLYVMKQIIEKNHAGRIQFSSQYGEGVKIEIYLLQS